MLVPLHTLLLCAGDLLDLRCSVVDQLPPLPGPALGRELPDPRSGIKQFQSGKVHLLFQDRGGTGSCCYPGGLASCHHHMPGTGYTQNG